MKRRDKGEESAKRVEADNHLQSAGECFMFLCWVESTMRDFLALQEGGDEMRLRYNETYGSASHPADFARKRLELGRLSFGQIKGRFLGKWPEWKDDQRIHDAVERIVIYRNGFSHAQVQPFREYLLYTPSRSSIRAIREFMKCAQCYQRLKDCECAPVNMAEPLTLVFRCRDSRFISQLYGDIRTVDLDCFLPTAERLDIAYQGVAWPEEKGYVLGEHRPTDPNR